MLCSVSSSLRISAATSAGRRLARALPPAAVPLLRERRQTPAHIVEEAWQCPTAPAFPSWRASAAWRAVCLASAPRRNFSSRFLWRSSLSAAFASCADVTVTDDRRAVDLGETHGSKLHG